VSEANGQTAVPRTDGTKTMEGRFSGTGGGQTVI
jgi:hypothetical protein